MRLMTEVQSVHIGTETVTDTDTDTDTHTCRTRVRFMRLSTVSADPSISSALSHTPIASSLHQQQTMHRLKPENPETSTQLCVLQYALQCVLQCVYLRKRLVKVGERQPCAGCVAGCVAVCVAV